MEEDRNKLLYKPLLVSPADKDFKSAEAKSSWNSYSMGYKTAADDLVDSYGSKYPYFWELHLSPICFLYRHAIELSIKLLYLHCQQVIDKPISKSHDKILLDHKLLPLWDLACHQMKLIVSLAPMNISLRLERVAEFTALDPFSIAFRYPTDKKGKGTLPTGLEIDLVTLKEGMDALFTAIAGCDDWVEHYADIKKEMDVGYDQYLVDEADEGY